MKWTLLFSLVGLLFSGVVKAEYSHARCESIKNEREQIRAKQREGYSSYEGERLRKRDDYLFIELSRHCSGQRFAGASGDTKGLSYNQRQQQLALQAQKDWEVLSQKFPDMSANNALYEGSKGDAWLSFLVIPEKCRVKNISYADFVWCSEDKQQQKSHFETFWAVNSGALSFPPVPVNPLNVALSGAHIGNGQILTTPESVNESPPWYAFLNLINKQDVSDYWREFLALVFVYWWLAFIVVFALCYAVFKRIKNKQHNNNEVIEFPTPSSSHLSADTTSATKTGAEAILVQPIDDDKKHDVHDKIRMNCPFCLEKVVEEINMEARTKTLTCSDAPICRFSKTEPLS